MEITIALALTTAADIALIYIVLWQGRRIKEQCKIIATQRDDLAQTKMISKIAIHGKHTKENVFTDDDGKQLRAGMLALVGGRGHGDRVQDTGVIRAKHTITAYETMRGEFWAYCKADVVDEVKDNPELL